MIRNPAFVLQKPRLCATGGQMIRNPAFVLQKPHTFAHIFTVFPLHHKAGFARFSAHDIVLPSI
jgi:hypothetical protein